jgi:hypothetical protein
MPTTIAGITIKTVLVASASVTVYESVITSSSKMVTLTTFKDFSATGETSSEGA